MGCVERRTFNGSMGEVINTAQWLDEIAVREALPADAVFALHVCAEELLSNVVRHSGSSGPQMAVGVDVDAERVELVIDDDGEPFDVSSAIPRKVSSDLDSVQPGGLGVQLIHEFATALNYERGPLGNRVRVTIALHGQPKPETTHP